MEYTIALLEAEIDSLKDAYKTSSSEEYKREYSMRIVDHKECLNLLRRSQYCQCQFVMVMRTDDDTPTCAKCGKIIEELKSSNHDSK